MMARGRTEREKRTRAAENSSPPRVSGRRHRAVGRFDEDTRYARMISVYEDGELDEADRLCEALLAEWGETFELVNMHAVLLVKLNRFSEAVTWFRKVIDLKPGVAEHHCNLAVALQGAGRNDEAEEEYVQAARIWPECLAAHNNLGCLRLERNPLLALWHFEVTARLAPDHAIAHANMTRALERLRATGHIPSVADSEDDRREQASRILHRALLEEAPGIADDPLSFAELGSALVGRWRVSEGMELLGLAMEKVRHRSVLWLHVGNILSRIGQFEAALDAYSRGLELCTLRRHGNPQWTYEVAAFHFMSAMSSLMIGRWDKGWPDYEWRLTLLRAVRPYSQPAWSGEPLRGKTVLVHAEQGLGDILQFARFLPEVKRRGAGRLLLECPAALARLLATSEAVDDVIVSDRPPTNKLGPAAPPLAHFDRHISMMSLPYILKTSLETLPADVPYILPQPAEVERWRARLASDTSFRVGLAWAGSPGQRDDFNRSCRLERFAPLAAVPGVTFYSLQKGKAGRQAPPEGMTLIDLTDDLEDMLDTAALVANLDLVIAVDTSIVHLAGALGRPVFTLVRLGADWRWMQGREDSPWYPTMRLFRQTRPYDWESVILRARDALAAMCGAVQSQGTQVPCGDSESDFLASTQNLTAWAASIIRPCFSVDGAPSFELTLNPRSPTESKMIAVHAQDSMYEPAQTRAILALVNRGHTVVDVGAHVGYFTHLAAALVGDEGKVISFEADPRNYLALRSNLAHNGFCNVEPVNRLLGAESAAVTLYAESDDGGGCAMWNVNKRPRDGRKPAHHERELEAGGSASARSSARRFRTSMVTLDQHLSGRTLDALRLIRLNTRGGDLDFLRGAARTIAQYQVPYILAIVDAFGLCQMGTDVEELDEFLRQQGYAGFALTDESPQQRMAWHPVQAARLHDLQGVLFARAGWVPQTAELLSAGGNQIPRS